MSFVRRTSSVPGRSERTSMRRARNQLPPEFATVHAAVCKPKSWWEERRRQYMEDDRVRFGLTITGKHDEASSVIAYRDEGEVEATHSGMEDGSSSSISHSAATPHSASSPPKESSSPSTSGLVVDTENRYPKTEDGLHDDLDEQVSNTSMSDDGLDADGMDHQSVATTATAATLGEGGLGMSAANPDDDIANADDVLAIEQHELDQARHSYNMSECSFQDDGSLHLPHHGDGIRSDTPTPPELITPQGASQARMPSAILGSAAVDDSMSNHHHSGGFGERGGTDSPIMRTSADDDEEEAYIQEALWADTNRRMNAMGAAFDPVKVGELVELAGGMTTSGPDQLSPYEAAEELYILDQSNPCQFMPTSIASFTFGFLWPHVGDQTALPYFVNRYQRLWRNGQSVHHQIWERDHTSAMPPPPQLYPPPADATPVRPTRTSSHPPSGAFVHGSEEYFRHRSELLPEGFSPPPMPSHGGFSPVVMFHNNQQFGAAPVVGGGFAPPPAVKKPSVFALAKARMALHDRVKGVLNKVSGDDSKYEAVLHELQQLPGLDTAEGEVLERVVDVFFAKAITEPQFSYRYAQLVRDLCNSSLQKHQQALSDAGMNLLPDEGKKILQDQLKKTLSNRMRVSLIKKCQVEFESRHRLELLISLNDDREEAEEAGGGVVTGVDLDRLIDRIEKEKGCLLGLVQFVGELYNCTLLNQWVIQAVTLGLAYGTASLSEVNRMEAANDIDYEDPSSVVFTYQPNQYEVDQLLLLMKTVLPGPFTYTAAAATIIPKVVYMCWYLSSHHSVRRAQCIARDILSVIASHASGVPAIKDALQCATKWDYQSASASGQQRSRAGSAPPTMTNATTPSRPSGSTYSTPAQRRGTASCGQAVIEAAKPPLAPNSSNGDLTAGPQVTQQVGFDLTTEPKSPAPRSLLHKGLSAHSSVRTNSPMSTDSNSTAGRKRLKQKKKDKQQTGSNSSSTVIVDPSSAGGGEVPPAAAGQFVVLRRSKGQSVGGGSSCGEGTFEDDRTSITSTATSGTAISCYSTRSRPLPGSLKWSANRAHPQPTRSMSLEGADAMMYRRPDPDAMSETGSAISGGTITNNPLIRTNSGTLGGCRPPSPPPIRPMRLIPMLPEASPAAVQCVGGYAMQLLGRCQAARPRPSPTASTTSSAATTSVDATSPTSSAPLGNDVFDRCLEDMCRTASLHTPEALLRSVAIWIDKSLLAARASPSFFDSFESHAAPSTGFGDEATSAGSVGGDGDSLHESCTDRGTPDTESHTLTLHHKSFAMAVQGFIHSVVRRRSRMLSYQYDAEEAVGAPTPQEGRSPEKGALVRSSTANTALKKERADEDTKAFVQQVQSICIDVFNGQLAKAIALDEDESNPAISSALSSGSAAPRSVSGRTSEVQRLFRAWATLVGCDDTKTLLHDGLHNGAFRLVLEAFLIPPGSSYRLQFSNLMALPSTATLNASGSFNNRVAGSDTASEGNPSPQPAFSTYSASSSPQYAYSCSAAGWRETLGINPSSPHRHGRSSGVSMTSPPGSATGPTSTTRTGKHTTIAPGALIDAACKNKTPRAALSDLVPESNLSAVALFVLEAHADPEVAPAYYQHAKEVVIKDQQRAAASSSPQRDADLIQHAAALLMSARTHLQLQTSRHRQPMEEGSFGRFRVLSELVRFRCEAWTEVFRTCSVPSRLQDTFEVAIMLSFLQERAGIQRRHMEAWSSRPGTAISYLAPPIAVDPEILSYLGLLLGPEFVRDHLAPPPVEAFIRGTIPPSLSSPIFPRGSIPSSAASGLVFGGSDRQTKATVHAVFEQLRTHPQFKHDVSLPAKVHSGILHAEVTTRTPIGMMLRHSILLLRCVIDSIDRARRELALVAEVFCGQQGLPAKEQLSPSVGPRLLSSLQEGEVITTPSVDRASAFFRSQANFARFMFFSGSTVLSDGNSPLGAGPGHSQPSGLHASSGNGGRHSPTSSVGQSSSMRLGASREQSGDALLVAAPAQQPTPSIADTHHHPVSHISKKKKDGSKKR